MLSDEEIKAIYERGKQNDLTDCHYGLFHDNKTYLQTTSYYYFLSGLVSHANAERIIEIGTFRGGSTKALSSGFGQADGSVISYDIKDFEPDFAGHPGIKPYIGDPLDPAALEFARSSFPNGIDLLFIDGVHDGTATLAQTMSYQFMFQPKWIVWDDVNLNPSMQKFSTLAVVMPEVRNIATDHPYVRRPADGFGVWKRP